MPRLTTQALRNAAFTSFISDAVLLTFSCVSLKSSLPIVPIREYEGMLVGSLVADYVGNQTSLKACHQNDRTAGFLADSVHGWQKEKGTEMSPVDSGMYHGPIFRIQRLGFRIPFTVPYRNTEGA